MRKYLPNLEARVIFLSDAKKMPLMAVAEKLGYEESSIKSIRRRGYDRLALVERGRADG